MKKIISMLLILCMAFSMAAFAEDDKGLSEAITYAKAVIEIPEEFTKFEYSTSMQDESSYWSLNWSDKEYKKGSINLIIDQKGNFISYSKYMYEYDKKAPELASITQEQAKTAADAFLKKALPGVAEKMCKSEYSSEYYTNDKFIFEYMQYENDIPVINNKCTIRINKNTGEVENFNAFAVKTVSYEPADTIIDENAATEKYLADIGVSLSYYSSYDYRTEELTVYPVYIPNDPMNKAISAIDGKVVELISPDLNYYDRAMKESASYAGGGMQFTKNELAAIEKVSGLMTMEQAASKLKEFIKGLPANTTITDGHLGQNGIDKDKFIWSFSFKSDDKYTGNGSIDAKSGELLNFNIYKEEKKDVKPITEEQAKQKVEEFLKKVAQNKFKQTKLGEPAPIIVRPMATKMMGIEQSDAYSFNYIRQVNGIDFAQNGLYVTYDNRNGEIINYSNTWYETAQFPAIDKVMSKSDIFAKMKEIAVYKVSYFEEKLVYNFMINNMLRFDPFTGVQLNYEGKPYEKIVVPEYEDIKGHWSENIVEALLENGIYKNTNQFNPDGNITQIEFFRFVLQWQTNGSNDDDVYEMLINQGYITEAEKNPTAEVTRQDAAKLFVKILGYDEVAEHSDIFVYPFADEIAQEYKGYVTICNAFGIISGDLEGNFNGGKNVTNAETAVMIYNMKTRVKK